MTLRNRYVDRSKKKRTLREMSLIVVGVLIIIALFHTAIRRYDKPSLEMKKCHTSGLSVETLKYQAYFRQAGAGIHALEVAQAVQHSKRKRLTAAICKVESGGKKTAYNRRTKVNGLYQVDKRYWGKVDTNSALAMTAQHDVIMDELLTASNGNLKKALNAYGGDTIKRTYAENILKELNKVPME